MKIVLIGAGSHSFGRGQIVDILANEEFKSREVELWLVDLHEKSLEEMTMLAEKIKTHFSSKVTIHSTTDRRKALPGADYVMSAVAIKRMELWEQDYRIPRAFGFPVCLGENGGPGALFHALRNFELIMPICRDIENLCPNALFFNFTNPEARVLNAIQTLTKVNAVGICHGIFSALQMITHYLERPLEELDVISAGMNHFYHIMELKEKNTGKDLKPLLYEKISSSPIDRFSPPLFRKMMKIFGIISYPSDDHIGEYLSFGSEYEGALWHYGRESLKVCREDCTKNEKNHGSSHLVKGTNWIEKMVGDRMIFSECAKGKRSLGEKILSGSGEIAVPIICDIEFDRNIRRPSVNVKNTEKYIKNVPEFGVVEVPAIVNKDGVHPMRIGSIPDPMAAIITTHFTIHRLLLEAYERKSKKVLLQALLLDPVINNIGKAEKMLDYFLEIQADYLPEFF